MRTAIINSKELTTKSLRASDYVASPRRIALKMVRLWNMEQGGVLNLRAPAGKRLLVFVEEAIREGMGKK